MSVDQLGLFETPPPAPATPKPAAQAHPRPADPRAVRVVSETFAGEKFGPAGERLPDDAPLGGFAVPIVEAAGEASPPTPAPVVEAAQAVEPAPVAQAATPAVPPFPADPVYVFTFVPLAEELGRPSEIRARLLLKIALRELGLRCARGRVMSRDELGAEGEVAP